MSNNLRQAAQQALEALENAYMVNSWAWVDQKKQVITALRAALAEPQTTHWEGCEAVHPECRKPEQEPVAFDFQKALRRAYQLGQKYWADADSESYSANKRADKHRQDFEVLCDKALAYTAPTPRKPWVGLTVEEIFDCTHHITRIQQDEWVATNADLCEFAHIVEKQLQKKNGYGTWNKPLTKEQIDNICKSFRLGYTDQDLARAIERAHGIGEQHE